MDKTNEHMFSVGELAGLCGITVRTLQYYDKSGLLHASLTEGGRRIYTREDLFRLQQILFLKSLGFPLDEIGNKILKDSNSAEVEKLFTQQREILMQQVENLHKIIETLDVVIADVQRNHEVSLKRLMAILQVMKEGKPYNFIVQYFSDEQFKSLAERFDAPDAYQSFATKTSEIFAKLEELFRQNANPEGAEGQELARRWWEMVCEFAAGDREMLHTLISSGKDISNWPKEAAPLREMVQNFLTPALDAYFRKNGISIAGEGEA